MTTAAERRRLLVPGRERVSVMAAEAYSAAALCGAPMLDAVEVIEFLRAESQTAIDGYRLTEIYNSAILKMVGEPLLPIMQNLRDQQRDALTEQACQIAFDGADDDAENRAFEWLRAFGEALCEDQLVVCAGLIEGGRRARVPEDWISQLDEAVRAAREDSWDKFGPAVERMLSKDIWEDSERAPLLAIESLIELFVFENKLNAESLAKKAIRLAPDGAYPAQAMAMVHLMKGSRDQAESVLLNALRIYPDSSIAHAAYTDCAWFSGDADEAEKRVLEGLKQVPYSLRLVAKMLELYCTTELFLVRQGRLPFIAVQVVAVDPDSEYRNEVLIAKAHYENGQSETAEGILRGVIATQPYRAEAHIELARLYLREDKLVESRVHLHNALGIQPESSEAAVVFAEICDAENDRKSAVEWSQRAIEWSVGNPALAYANLAKRQSVAGDDELAWASAVRAVEAAPDDSRIADVLNDLIVGRWKSGHQSDVRAFFDAMLSGRGEAFRPNYYNLIGTVAFQAKDYETAAIEFRHAIDLDADTEIYTINLADTFVKLGHWSDAQESLDRVLAINGDHEAYAREMGLIHNERGIAAYLENRFDEAVAAYEEALALRPTDAVLYGNLALALQSISRSGERTSILNRAVEALKEAHSLDPNGDYGVRLARAEERLRRVQRFGELIETPMFTNPIIVEFADDLIPLVDPAQRGQSVLDVTIPAMRDELRNQLGFDFPGVHMRGSFLAANEYRIMFMGGIFAAGTAIPDLECVVASREALALRGVANDALIEGTDAVTGLPCTWAPAAVLAPSDLTGLSRLTAVDVIFRHLGDLLRRNAGLFFTLDTATEWIRAVWIQSTGALPTEPERRSEGARRDHRNLAVARALRACVQDQVRIDWSLLHTLEQAIDKYADRTETEWNALECAAFAVKDMWPSVPRRLSASPTLSLPAWAETILESGRWLLPLEEHNLLRELEVHVERDRRLTVQTRHGEARAHLARLINDRFANVPGFDLDVVSDESTETSSNALLVAPEELGRGLS
jgi:tetratricopeptide (TPR) repeat protein